MLLPAMSLAMLVQVCARSMTFPMRRLPCPHTSAPQLRMPSLFEAPPTRWEMLSSLSDVESQSAAFDPLINTRTAPPLLFRVAPPTLQTLLLAFHPPLRLMKRRALHPGPWPLRRLCPVPPHLGLRRPPLSHPLPLLLHYTLPPPHPC